MKYADMSDFEINKAVAEILTDGDVIEKDDMWPTDNENAVQIVYKIGVSGEYKDYCNNPSDAWPIIIENDIGIYPININHEWTANRWAVGSSISGVHANPLRAAMIVFLMMQDANHEQ